MRLCIRIAMSGQGIPAVGIMAGAVLSEETRYYKRYTVLWLGRLRRRKGAGACQRYGMPCD